MVEKKTTSKTTKIEKPVWLKYTEKEIKEIILNLIKKDPELTTEKIGLTLRDTYGIPKTKIYGFRIGDVLREAQLYEQPDLKNITKKIERSMIITKAKLKKTKEYLAKKQKKRNQSL